MHLQPEIQLISLAAIALPLNETLVIEKLLSLEYIDGVITNVPINPMIWGLKPPPVDNDKVLNNAIETAFQAVRLLVTLPKKYNKPLITVRFRRTDDPITDILKEGGNTCI